MTSTNRYTRLEEVISRVLRHPMLQSVTIEDGIQYAVDFIHAVGAPEMFQQKEAILKVENHMAALPCDFVSDDQVMDLKTHKCLRGMTDTFDPRDDHHPHNRPHFHEDSYKIQNSVIVTSFPCGEIKLAYKAVAVDEEGHPLIMDNPTYHKALELYIKKEVFTQLFDMGKINANIMTKTEQDYYAKVRQLEEELYTPSISEMESLMRSWTTLIQHTTEFDNGFRHLGNREYIKRH